MTLFTSSEYDQEQKARYDVFAGELMRVCPTLHEAGWTVARGLRGYQSVWLVHEYERGADRKGDGAKARGRRWRIGGPVREVELF